MCYPEMVGEKYPLLYDNGKFLNTIEAMLDDTGLRTKANKYLELKLEGFK